MASFRTLGCRGCSRPEGEHAGASRRVTVTLDPEALSYWDAAADARVTPAGPVRVVVGRSADAAVLRGRMVLR